MTGRTGIIRKGSIGPLVRLWCCRRMDTRFAARKWVEEGEDLLYARDTRDHLPRNLTAILSLVTDCRGEPGHGTGNCQPAECGDQYFHLLIRIW